MKKSLLAALFLVITIASSIVFYQIGFNAGKQHYKNDRATDTTAVDDLPSDSSIVKIDFPLIDIAFNDGNDWIVVIANGIYTENPTYRFCNNGEELQFCKEFLYVHTFPAGRGTTPDGCITVYKNGQEVKSVEYFKMVIESETVENAFEKTTHDKLDKIISGYSSEEANSNFGYISEVPVKDVEAVVGENGLTSEEAEQLCFKVLGDKDEDMTGFPKSYKCIGGVSANNKLYYVMHITWLVDNNHWSYIGNCYVSSDGKEIYDGVVQPAEYTIMDLIWHE
ncbi:MAG: hypothetical protein IJ297_04320 [Clostridia bacterium]|nr:hypothetical protein [Clostridia bacterium]